MSQSTADSDIGNSSMHLLQSKPSSVSLKVFVLLSLQNITRAPQFWQDLSFVGWTLSLFADSTLASILEGEVL